MPDLADITLLILVAATAMVYHVLFTRRWLRRHADQTNRYRLFAVRDALIRLVAEGRVRENNAQFQKIYKTVNSLVNEVDRITFRVFVDALVRAKKKGLDPASEMSEIENEHLARVAVMFLQAVMQILLQKSLWLRFAVRCARFFPDKDGHGLPPVQRKALQIYRDYSQTSSRYGAAA